MTLKEISQRIHAHLKRMENDTEINTEDRYGCKKYWLSEARAGTKNIVIRYNYYCGKFQLKQPQAEDYLAWLDSGNNDSHLAMKESK